MEFYLIVVASLQLIVTQLFPHLSMQQNAFFCWPCSMPHRAALPALILNALL